jgi:hypothetical protein
MLPGQDQNLPLVACFNQRFRSVSLSHPTWNQATLSRDAVTRYAP